MTARCQLPTPVTEALGFLPNEQQQTAIQAPFARPVLISAGAGAGKTTVMAARVLWSVVEGHVEPQRVLGLTFTSKAATEFGGRVRRLVSDYCGVDSDDQHLPTALTYHSFAHQLVTEFGPLIGVDNSAALLADYEGFDVACQFVRSYADGAALGRGVTAAAQTIVTFDGRLAENDVSIAQIHDHSIRFSEMVSASEKTVARDRAAALAAQRRAALATAVAEFREFKRQEGVMDFSDLLRFAAELSHSAVVRRQLRDRWRMVMLDEYQDTSVVQGRFLARLFGGGHPVTAVGDPLQAIYGWRGASSASMVDFADLFASDGSVVKLGLTVSQRCAPAVLAAANAVSAPLRRELPAPMSDPLRSAISSSNGSVRTACFDTVRQETAWVANQVSHALTAGHRPEDVAILCRTSAIMAAVIDQLRAAGVRYCATGATGLLCVPEVRQLLAMMACAWTDDNVSTLEVLAGPRFRLGARDLAILGRRARDIARIDRHRGRPDQRHGAEPPMLLEAVLDAGPRVDYPLSDDAYRRLAQLRAELTELRSAPELSVAGQLEAVIGVTSCDLQLALLDDASVRRAVWQLRQLANRFGSMASGGAPAFVGWLKLLAESGFGPRLAVAPGAGEVTVTTIHQAKGLEWNVVFVPGMATGSFPVSKGIPKWTNDALAIPHSLRADASTLAELAGLGTSAHDDFAVCMKVAADHDERRLGYVAATRARSLLVCSGHWWSANGSRTRGPANQLLEIREEISADDASPWCATASESNPQLGAVHPVWQSHATPGSGANVDVNTAPMSDTEAAMLAEIDHDIDALTKLAALADSHSSRVAGPKIASVTELTNVSRPRDGSARQRQRGIAFHEWVARRFGQQPLFGGELSAGLAAEDIADLIAGFHRSEFAERTPVAIEYPFTVALDGVSVSGRIDAVFRDGDRWQVVDWKIGDSGDDRQLHLYRRAWALAQDVSSEMIDCYFVNVATGASRQLVANDEVPLPRPDGRSLLRRSLARSSASS